MIPWLEAFVTESADRLAALPPDADARTYLVSRGVTDAYQSDYRVGWLSVPTATTATPDFWAWLQKYGWQWFVFPLTDPFGEVTGVVLRSLPSKGYHNYIAYPKDLCAPCFGLHVALPVAYETKRMVLVEGIFDYFAVRPFTEGVVASLTSMPSTLLRRLLTRYVTKVVTLADMDAAGRRAAYRLAGVPVPPEYREDRDKVQTKLFPSPFHVVIPAYSAHDPSDLLLAGKYDELRRLSAL